MDSYTQVRLDKSIHGGFKQQTAWIPTPLATQGKTIRIGQEDGWRIVGVYGVIKADSMVDRRDEYRYHRKRTDA